jgi:hypothetical protein
MDLYSNFFDMQAYLLMTEGAKFHHGVHTVNISISAQNACFGSWWVVSSLF